MQHHEIFRSIILHSRFPYNRIRALSTKLPKAQTLQYDKHLALNSSTSRTNENRGLLPNPIFQSILYFIITVMLHRTNSSHVS